MENAMIKSGKSLLYGLQGVTMEAPETAIQASIAGKTPPISANGLAFAGKTKTGRNEAATSPGPDHSEGRFAMDNRDVPEMYRGSQKMIDGWRFIAALTRDADHPFSVPVADAVDAHREVAYRPLPRIMTIYFIGSAAGPIKIGRASRVAFRLKDLRNASPVALELLATIEGDPSLEREYHRRFAEHRLHGEWFSPAPEILAEIARLSSLPTSTTGREV